MEHNNDETVVDVASCDPDNAENNLPADEMNSGSVEYDNQATDLKKSHTIPLVTVWCLLTLVYPIMCHVFDFVNDVRLTFDYFANLKTGFGSLTIAFTIFPAIASAWISLMMHYSTWEEIFGESKDVKSEADAPLEKITEKTAEYGIIITLERAFRLCHVLKLYYTWKIRQSQQKEDQDLVEHYNRKMLEVDRNSAVIEVVECFLQSAPQFGLQLYILLTQDTPISEPMWYKIVSSCMTLYNFGKTMRDYHCAVRAARPDKAAISEIGGDLVLLWHLCTIAGRILVIGVAASNWLYCTISACVFNWLLWTVWFFVTENVVSIFHGKKSNNSPSNPTTATQTIRDFVLASVLASVYTFTFINLREGRSFISNALYYMLSLVQNCIAIAFSFTLENMIIENSNLLPKDVLNIISVICSFIGITAMIIYYLFFHPSLERKAYDQLEFVRIV